MEKKFRYLVPGDYMADPAVHVFDGKLYIYPSHDRESGVEENDNGDHFDMCDYHVFSTEDVMNGTVTRWLSPAYKRQLIHLYFLVAALNLGSYTDCPVFKS